MLHPHTELRFVNERIGHGVFATHRIPRGTITWTRCDLDQAFSAEQFRLMSPTYRELVDKFSFVDNNGDYILCWDNARLVNHSCRASCMSPGFDFEIAVRDIEAGEELTDDYGSLNLDEPFECACGEPCCRRVIRPEDMRLLHPAWDAQVRASFPFIAQVEQPLWELVREKREIEEVLAGRLEVPSCYLPPGSAGPLELLPRVAAAGE